MEKTQSSRRYATALLESITHSKEVSMDEALGQLSVLRDAVNATFDLKNVLMNPVFTHAERDKAFEQIIGHLRLAPVIRVFVKLLVDKRRIGELDEIVETFRSLADEQRGRRRALVESAAPLSPDATDRLRQALERATGHSISIEVKVDPALIGGLRARVGSTVYDGTVRAELDRLRLALAGGE